MSDKSIEEIIDTLIEAVYNKKLIDPARRKAIADIKNQYKVVGKNDKKCTICGEVKRLTEFYRHRRCKDGYRNQCKKCCDAYNKEFNSKNRDKQRQYSRNNYRNNKATWEKYRDKTLYGGNKGKVFKRDNNTCQECGTKENLSIHHMDGENFKNSDSPNHDMNNLVTLCMSCHAKVHKNWKKIKRNILYAQRKA